MTTTTVKSGASLTSTTTEQDIAPDRGGRVLLYVELISGSVQMTTVIVGSGNPSPVINNTYTTYSVAGTKKLFEVDRGAMHLRIVGSGVVDITY